MNTWNASAWKAEFDRANVAKYTNDVLRKVFLNTVEIVREQKYKDENGKEIALGTSPTIEEDTRFYNRELPQIPAASRTSQTRIRVVKGDMLDVAFQLSKVIDSNSISVLNMASRRNPGGGVYNGARAQEEQLFRRSDYFKSLYQFTDYAPLYGVTRARESYPLNRDFGGCFSRHITIFRDGQAKGYALLEQPWVTNFIAVPAINNPDTVVVDSERIMTDEMVEGTKNKIRTILRIAYHNGQRHLVLGAFGCGAFHNPPEHVARIFRDVLEEKEFQGVFSTVLFGILDDHNASRNGVSNYDAFCQVYEPIGMDEICDWMSSVACSVRIPQQKNR